MRTSTHVFATDLLDEGYDTVLGRVRDLGHLDAVTYAGVYHHARDILPHDPVRKVIFHEGGHAFFRISPDLHAGNSIKPRVSRLVDDEDPLDRLIREADRRGLSVRVWTNNAHNTALGVKHPEATVTNAFGDAYITSLCPANPDVRSYVRDLSRDVCRYPISALILETVCYLPFKHGYHHERSHYPYSPVADFLLGLCFCDHCGKAMASEDFDPIALRHDVRRVLTDVLDGQPSSIDAIPLEQPAVAQLFSGRMAGLLRARRHVVSSLLEEVMGTVRESSQVPVVFMDWSGGLRGYASGEAEAGGALARAWQDGVDLEEVIRVCDGLAALGYTNDGSSFEADLERYRRLVPADRELSIAIRPMLPDSTTPGDVREKTAMARAHDVDWLEFYHYGLMRLESLRWAGEAIQATEEAR